MKFEFSAGVIVYTYTNGERKFLLLKSMENSRFAPPKGHIEKGENSRETAIRETFEETGLRVDPDPYFRSEISYMFTEKNGEKIKKKVTFYLAKVHSDVKVKISHEHIAYRWISLRAYEELAHYRNTLQLIKSTNDYIDRLEALEKLNLEYGKLPEKHKDWLLSRNFVPGEGPANSKLMFIGQAPGRTEDEKLRPFVGSAGKLLDHLIRTARLRREKVYITSVVQFFPPENRLPSDEEAELCLPHLKKQIEIIKPELIVALGSFAARFLGGPQEVMSSHGVVMRNKEFNCRIFISLHPAAAVRIKKFVPLMEKDFRTLGREIKRRN